MSATLDVQAVATLLGNAPAISCRGRSHPVEMRYSGRPRDRTLETAIAGVVRTAAASSDGSILVFLPGAPEIRRTARLLEQADLAAMILETAIWGIADPPHLKWVDVPPAAAIEQARNLLTDLGALGKDGKVSEHGRLMADLPLHPPLAHMVLAAKSRGMGATACELAALLSERDILYFSPGERHADLGLRIDALQALKDGGVGNAPCGRNPWGP